MLLLQLLSKDFYMDMSLSLQDGCGLKETGCLASLPVVQNTVYWLHCPAAIQAGGLEVNFGKFHAQQK